MENTLLGYAVELSKSYFAIVATLLPIMNPPSGAALFLSVTNGASAKTRHVLAKIIARNCFILMICFILLGSFVLKFFGISQDIVLIGGGLLVINMGWGLLNADATAATPDQLNEPQSPEHLIKKSFFPLSFPLTVGPGVLAASLTLSVSFSTSTHGSFTAMIPSFIGGLLAIITLAGIVRFCYGYAEKLMSMLGETGTIVFLRFCAFILLCIGIQLVWNGIASAVTNLYRTLDHSAVQITETSQRPSNDFFEYFTQRNTNPAHALPQTTETTTLHTEPVPLSSTIE